MTYPRGSEWRRWDLHLHAPGTALADQFGDWDEFLGAVETADKSIVVAGITDYASINTYKTFKTYQDAGHLQNIALAIPNIEFRISPETKAGKGINLHLLVSPDDAEHVERIEEALGRLKVRRNNEDIPCSQAGLLRLGKLTKPDLKSTPEAAYCEGVNQFKVDFEHFRNWFVAEEWLSRNALVAIAAGSGDGASGLIDGGYQATRREIYAFADIIFSGNPNEREAWLGRGGIPAEEFESVRLPKPVVHGSDAHSIAKLFEPDNRRYCWIKADPTFEGLRQILYEPEDRVWIGELPPTTHEARTVVDMLVVADSNGWFEDGRDIPLNSGLVAIIGLKGSGKTALADIIAFTAGAQLDEENSFLTRAKEHISGLNSLLVWTDGTPEPAVVPDQPGGQSGASVKYLSQKFVDNLCSGDVLSEELHREIESVIFLHLELEDRLDAESFDELRQMRTHAIRAARAEINNQIHQESELIADTDERRATILKKTARRIDLPNQIAKVAKSMPQINDQATAKLIKNLQTLREQHTALGQTVASARATKQRVQDIERQIALKLADLAKFWTSAAAALKQVGFSAPDIAKLAPSWTKHPEIFQSRAQQLDNQIVTLGGAKAGASAGSATIAGLDAAIKKLENDMTLDKANKGKVLALGKQRQELVEEKRRLDAEHDWVQKSYKNERQEAQTRRMDAYLSYFELLKEERNVLEELYAPLRADLATQGAHEKKLDFVCRIEADTAAWVAKGAELFDLRKTGSFRYDSIEAIAVSELTRAWQSCDSQKIRVALDKCLALIKEADVLRTQLKAGFHPRDVAEWLFGVDQISVTHGIQYEGKDLRLLSPGTKGIVLLILYLSVDRFDTRPLIVDQPDENLDNLSTYEILRAYFREAKKRRQIIIITHNPNLVVNTDAEQVIVAESSVRPNGLPYITYSYGSLEALEMDGTLKGPTRGAVCRIMEGGKDAFKMRESRYGQILNE